MAELKTETFHLRAGPLALAQGSRTAIAGANGSGKTTLVETILGLRQGNRLDGRILGRPPGEWRTSPALRRRVGVQLQHGLYPGQLTAPELVALHRAMFRHAEPGVAGALGLGELGGRTYRELSHGQKQRLNLYMALAHRPELAILDEPFTGLDRTHATGVAEILAAKGPGTLLPIGHTPPELALARQMIWMKSGRVAFFGDVATALERHCRRCKASLTLPDPVVAKRVMADAGKLDGFRHAGRSGRDGLEIFGGASLKDFVGGQVRQLGIERFPLDKSGLDDLLRFLSNGGGNV